MGSVTLVASSTHIPPITSDNVQQQLIITKEAINVEAPSQTQNIPSSQEVGSLKNILNLLLLLGYHKVVKAYSSCRGKIVVRTITQLLLATTNVM